MIQMMIIKMKIKNAKFDDIYKEYMINDDIFNDDEYTPLLSILQELNEEDKRLLILYAELQSLRKVAKIFNCSDFTIRARLKPIKEKFLTSVSKGYIDKHNKLSSNKIWLIQ